MALYPFVQSYVYSRDGGCSRTFQAIFAFSRSTLVLLAGPPVVYLGHHWLRQAGLVDRPPKYLLFFPTFGEFLEAVWPLSWLGALLFLYATSSYKRHFVEYLVSDFVALRAEE